MWPGFHAAQRPDHPAVVMAGAGNVVTYAELEAGSNRLAHVFAEAGLGFGDHVAFLLPNEPRLLEVCWAAQRSGLYYTAVNWHLTAEEVAYIVDDCEARALVVGAAFAEVAGELAGFLPDRVGLRLAAGGRVAGYDRYEDVVADASPDPVDEQLEGHAMLYSSGTTGRPKGVRYALERRPIGEPGLAVEGFRLMYGLDEETVYLSPAPMYHAAPLQWCLAVTRLGGTAVIMEQFEPEAALAAIEAHRITHSQWVPTMFVRLLKLPEAARSGYDLSSHRVAVHAAAPCPVAVKQAMLDWWGPIIHEYYAATEAVGATAIGPEEWLAHPGSVGRPVGSTVHICDDDGEDVPVGEVGVVWFEKSADIGLQFEYHNDPAKTAGAHDRRGWATTWDMGRLDEEGYLYLTDRKDFMIVSGGVNIYPQEAENVLIAHPRVLDAAVFGVPDDEMGEQVKAVVQPLAWQDAGPDLEQELLAHCREHLAHYKCPRSVDFEPELPRHDTGKLYKRLLRDRYWGDQESRIV
jgi:acyl-CoA synthetase (AMP-forming)/AMP-acid ligase II